MGKQRAKQPPARRPRWQWAALGGIILVAVGAGAFWWLSEAQDTFGGTPRLVVDRSEVDLGYRRFETAARVVFTFRNAGDGSLRLKEVPRVIVKAGC